MTTDALRGRLPRRNHWTLIERALASLPVLTMIQAQDVLGLGRDSRMNRPGEPYGNWRWQLKADQLTDDLAVRLRAVTESTGRGNQGPVAGVWSSWTAASSD